MKKPEISEKNYFNLRRDCDQNLKSEKKLSLDKSYLLGTKTLATFRSTTELLPLTKKLL